MKKIFRKNQFIITALALMIAVAGYISYMNKDMDDTALTVTSDALEEEYEISEEDSLLEGEIFTDEMEETIESTETLSENTDVALEENAPIEENAVEETKDMEDAGEAVLTSTIPDNASFAAEIKLNREQIRAKNKETLLQIVNNESVTEAQKQAAIDEMITMTDIAERESATEMLLEAKGFSDVVVSITDESCDVVLNMGEVTDAKRAQVEDIVKRKTMISAENIVITPINTAVETPTE